jgi:hypothetical protein
METKGPYVGTPILRHRELFGVAEKYVVGTHD